MKNPTLLAIWVGCALIGARSLPAIVVTTTADENGENPEACALREAVAVIHEKASFGGCPFVHGDLVIELDAAIYEISLATGAIEITKPLTLVGQGPSLTTIQRSGAVFDADLFRIELALETSARLEGFTLRSATGDGHSAIRVTGREGTELLLHDLVLRDNAGGAAALEIEGFDSSSIELERVLFENNANDLGSGGAISCDVVDTSASVALKLREVLVRQNQTTRADGAAGGGIFSVGCDLDLENVTFDSNSALATAGFAGGGGLFISDYFGSATRVELTNVTFFNNSAGIGGGVLMFGGAGPSFQATLTNVTFADNRAGIDGDHFFQDSGVASLRNVLFGPSSGDDCSGNPVPVFSLLGGNMDSDGTCGVEQTDDNPGLDAVLADHGGFTPTVALLPEGAALDAGTDDGCPDRDQRGIQRPEDADENGQAVCDVGAFERGNTLFSDGFESGDASAWSATVP